MLGFLLALAGPSAAPAEPVFRSSGKVVQVDVAAGVVVVDELAERGQRRRREVRVDPGTPLVSSARPRPWSAYDEVAVSLLDLLVGDFVVVEWSLVEGRAVARRLTVVEALRAPAPRGLHRARPPAR